MEYKGETGRQTHTDKHTDGRLNENIPFLVKQRANRRTHPFPFGGKSSLECCVLLLCLCARKIFVRAIYGHVASKPNTGKEGDIYVLEVEES